MDEENLVLPDEGGISIRAYRRVDASDESQQMLDFMVYPLPERIVNELADFLGQQAEQFLIDRKLAEGPFEEVSDIPAGVTLQ